MERTEHSPIILYISRISRVMICAIMASMLSYMIIVKVIPERMYHDLDSIDIEWLEKKNPASAGMQIRICGLENQDGEIRSLRDIADEFGWTYDEDLKSLAFYGIGEDTVHVDLHGTSKLYLSLLKQPTSGIVNVYIGGQLYDTWDLYSDQWCIETKEIAGDYNIPIIIGIFIGLFVVLFLFMYVYALLLGDWRRHRRAKAIAISCWFIYGMAVVLVGGCGLYPQIEWCFEEGNPNTELHDFILEDDILHSVSGDPNVSFTLNERKAFIQSVSILGVEEIAYSEWAQAFLMGDAYLRQDFFIKNGYNVIKFPLKMNSENKTSMVRLDLVSRPDMDIKISRVVLNERRVLIPRLAADYGLLVIFLVLIMAICQLVYRRKQNVLRITFFAIHPIVLFWAASRLNGDILTMKSEIWIWTYIVLLLWQLIFLAILNHPLVAMGATGAIWLLLAIVNYYVTRFRGMPLSLNDIHNIRTAMTVADNYAYEVPSDIVLSIMGYLCFIALAVCLQKICKGECRKKSLRLPGGWKGYSLRIAVMVSAVTVMVWIIRSGKYGVTYGTMNVVSVYSENGFVLGFLSSNPGIEKPAGYSLERVQEILKKYNNSIEWQEMEKYPNIIVVMNESFADVSMFYPFETNREVMPNYHGLQQNVIKGRCHMSVIGGGTANSEFEMLTGNTMAFFPAGTCAYTQYCSNDMISLVSYLKKLNYECVAIHPATASNYNRNNVYRYMGFDEFLSADSFKGAEVIRYVSDMATYEKVFDVYEGKEKEVPLFIFDLTMQNHGGYGTAYDWEEPVVILEDEYPMSNEYLSSLYVSDKAFGNLIAYFQEAEEPTIVLFFGDHQPIIGDDFIAGLMKKAGYEGDVHQYYITPFVIWANYEIGTQLNQELSANYLATKLLEATGIPGTDVNLFLAALYEQFPVITANGYMDSGNTWHYWDEEMEWPEMLEEYRLIQYAVFADRSEEARALFGY